MLRCNVKSTCKETDLSHIQGQRRAKLIFIDPFIVCTSIIRFNLNVVWEREQLYSHLNNINVIIKMIIVIITLGH